LAEFKKKHDEKDAAPKSIIPLLLKRVSSTTNPNNTRYQQCPPEAVTKPLMGTNKPVVGMDCLPCLLFINHHHSATKNPSTVLVRPRTTAMAMAMARAG
jgi:hypothetical protein